MPFGNVYANVKRKYLALSCTCKRTYETVVDVCKKYITHFGSCKINLEASIWTRQFNAMCFPETKRAADFVAFIRNDFANFLANLPDYIRRANIDFSWDTFLAESAPAKRAVYKRAREEFLQRPKWQPKLKFFSKSNEVHHGGDPRPRNIACFDEVTTAFGAYIARIFLKLLKQHHPGIVSGCNLEELGKKIGTAQYVADINSPNWYMADGSGWDSHQHKYLQNEVDRPYARAMLDAITPFLDIPLYAVPKLADTLLSEKIVATTELGDRIEVLATVLSGNPWATTPFNSLRNSLAQYYAMAVAGTRGVAFVSGDDSLCLTVDKINTEAYWKVFSKSSIRKYGIGYLMKDFKMGYLHEMDFLSKNFVTLNQKVEAYRKASKVAVSGVVSSSISKNLTVADFCRMQMLQLADLPRRLSAAYERFAAKAAPLLKPALLEAMKFDWSYKLYMKVRKLKLDDLYYTLHPPIIAPPAEDVFFGGAKAAATEKPKPFSFSAWHSMRPTRRRQRLHGSHKRWNQRRLYLAQSPSVERECFETADHKFRRGYAEWCATRLERDSIDTRSWLKALRGLRRGPLKPTLRARDRAPRNMVGSARAEHPAAAASSR